MIWAKEPPTPETVADALMLVDVLELERQQVERGQKRSRTREVHDIWLRVMDEAVAQYLRLHPTARADSHCRYVAIQQVKQIGYVCLFCRADLATLTKVWEKNETRAMNAFIRKLYTHADLCAARYLAGQIDGKRPRRDETIPALASMDGKRLIRYAREAADYLGKPRIRAKAVGRGLWGRQRVAPTKRRELRALVREARKAAKEVAVMAVGEAPWRAA